LSAEESLVPKKSRWDDDDDTPVEEPKPVKIKAKPVVQEQQDEQDMAVEHDGFHIPMPQAHQKRKIEPAEEEDEPLMKRQRSIVADPTAVKSASVGGMVSCRSVSNYDKVCSLGQGAYGVVYKAKDRATGEMVALKQIKMKKEREGFPLTSVREVRILMQCRHLNIVDLKEVVVGKNVDDIFIVMEYIEHDLKGLLEDMGKPFSIAETKCMMHQLLLGMEYLHENWILHRDIKTSNLLLNNRGILKIADFGLARPYGEPIRPYTRVVVTLWYRAPELLLGETVYTPAIDMFAVGCVFAEILYGKAILQGTNETNQLDKMFKLLGSPHVSEWPEWQTLPDAKHFKFNKRIPNDLRSLFPENRLSPYGLDFMRRMLSYNPITRLSASKALQHEYWEESPQMKDSDLMPTWPSRSEGRKTRRPEQASPSANADAEKIRDQQRDAFVGMRDRQTYFMAGVFK